jgi:tripartite-type tricarboxylate transporter receptor subunit TctC
MHRITLPQPENTMTHQQNMRRSFLQATVAASAVLLSLGVSRHTLAQSPVNQLRILCSGPAGSIPDIIARRVGEQLNGHYAQGVFVDNRPGAAGQIAVNALKTAPADGSTILLAQGAIATVYPYLYPKLSYDPIADLQPVSLAGEMTLALAVGPAVPATIASVAELVAWMRSNPKLANVGSPGIGTLPHLLEALLFRDAGVDWQHVVYAGGPPAMVDLLGGQIAALVLPEGLFRQHKATGRLRVLATSGAQRSTYFEDVPSLVESGFRDMVIREWFAFFAPGMLASTVIEKTSQHIKAAVAQPELAAAFAQFGMTPASSTPADLAARIASEQRHWQPKLLTAGIKVE